MNYNVELTENVNHYHLVSISDELDLEEIMDEVRISLNMYDTAHEAMEAILKKYKDKYDYDYRIEPNYCGTSINSVSVMTRFNTMLMNC